MTGYEVFGEAYYQDGEEGCSAYRCYRESVRQAPFFREVAEIIRKVFKPTRVLEVGCATGIIVKHLNDMGIETYGCDVSEWAVSQREHPNVSQAPVEKLPFPDKHFDLVYSSGTMEHVPPAVRDQGFRELDRVCKTYQFHMIPILGEGPYRGEDRAEVLRGFHIDKTHYNAFDRQQWLELFAAVGWRDTGLRCIYAHDSWQFENSWCNLILSRGGPDPAVAQAVDRHNLEAAETIFRRGFEFTAPTFRPTPGERGVMSEAGPVVAFTGQWNDEIADFSPAIDIDGALFRAFVQVEAAQPVRLRWAILTGGGEDHVLERFGTFAPGHSMVQFRRSDIGVTRGFPDLRQTTRICFGGVAPGAKVRTSLVAIRGQEERQLLPAPGRTLP